LYLILPLNLRADKNTMTKWRFDIHMIVLFYIGGEERELGDKRLGKRLR
jgi:hypothetical protein